jgi:hypothetical protein
MQTNLSQKLHITSIDINLERYHTSVNQESELQKKLKEKRVI